MMLISKAKQLTVLKHLFKEGVLVAHADTTKKKHELIEGVTNLEVLCIMKSMTSRGYVKRVYCWRHNYWFLNEEGIEYLRKFLHLPADVVPATHKKPAAPAARPSGDVRGGRGFEGERRSYGGKDGGPGRDFNPSYQGERSGGFGRGGGGFGRGN